MADTPRNDITITGGGTIAPGNYENVTINGGGTVTGDLVCTVLRINGVGTCQGSVQAATLEVHGTATFSSTVQAIQMSVNGNADVRAGLGVNKLVVRGKLSAGGSVCADNLDLKGVVHSDGDIAAETVRGEGAIEAVDVTATVLDLAVYGPSKVRNLNASERIVLRAPGSFGDIVAIFAEHRFTAETVRAREVWLDYATVNVVSAGNASIGPSARVGLVLHSGTYTAAEGAQVAEARQADPGV